MKNPEERQAKTILQKIWAAHQIAVEPNGESLIHVDRLFMDETAFNCLYRLRELGLKVRSPQSAYLMVSHLAPIRNRELGPQNPQVIEILKIAEEFASQTGINLLRYNDSRQGIYHVVGPEQGITLPGLIVAGTDSHTTTHGALGCLGFGIGYDSATQVLAEDAFWHSSVPSMLVQIEGQLSTGITAKDLALALVGKIGARGAIGQCVEYTGSTVRALSMEARMTLCSMSVEAGGRLGVIAPDDTTFQYVAQRSLAPKGAMWDRALEYWKTLPTDDDAEFASVVSVDANSIPPMVTWGVSTDHVASIDGVVPDPTSVSDPSRRNEIINALAYMDILPGTKIEEIPIDEVFIGSCTNGRIEDLRAAASVLKGRKAKIPGLVTPGSTPVRKQAEAEGLDRIFLDAGLEWGSAGCSLCLGLYDHVVAPGRRCASSANRNFKGRQGQGSRTHLMSPSMVAAAAIEGKITDVRKLM